MNKVWVVDLEFLAKHIEGNARVALKALQDANKGKDAERTGVSAKTLARMNNK